ncbi:hypothetical protein Mal4_52830 [Maioricimonas rarisocia]|uniref:Uncharacterized protein n=1 Tax=Maioricimonas rarisocia TaxID=2528026 RepID=A0A517ZEL2_9PLAN|nr:hypothetical protein [Maioricimonas rarisocia]QDU40920.1 hypothetical protein Mal4_52830 [Maioricimonas rarisocia]
MKLESELNRSSEKEVRVRRLCFVMILAATVLMFLGGTEVLGSFDPFDPTANPLSVALGVVHVICAVAAPMLVAYYYARLRPATRSLRDDLLQHSIREVRHELHEVRNELSGLHRRSEA